MQFGGLGHRCFVSHPSRPLSSCSVDGGSKLEGGQRIVVYYVLSWNIPR